MVALQDIDLRDRAQASSPRILGPSGCGKSTLLNMVAGFDRPSAGASTSTASRSAGPSPQRAVVFQEAALFPWLTVWRTWSSGRRRMGERPRRTTARKPPRLLEQVGLRGFERHYPAELSGGMKQRVGIARVLVMEPRGAADGRALRRLDAQTRSVMQELLLAVWERHHQTVLFITHDIEEALLLADTRLRHDGAARPDQAAPGGGPAAPALAGGHHLGRLQRAASARCSR